MEYALYAIFFVSCLVLVGSVLLQPGKTDAGALFTSNVSSSAFAPRGTATVLSKITIGAATVFMLSALMLSLPAITGSGSRSVLDTAPETTPAAEQAPPAEATPSPDPAAASVAPTQPGTETPAAASPAASPEVR